jgi:exosortase/archaeosortase family protein
MVTCVYTAPIGMLIWTCMGMKRRGSMSDPQGGLVTTHEAEAATKDRKALRRKTIRFVVVFIGSVFGLLWLHSAVVNTRGNDYYLYQVARSTAYLLDWVGDSGRVVGHPKTYRGKEAYVRACMDAWRRGGETPPPEQFKGVEAPPLTPWESWAYSAASERRELARLLQVWNERGDLWRFNPINRAEVEEVRANIDRLQNRDRGPTVSFVLRTGLTSQIAQARQAAAKLQQDKTLSENERAARVSEAKARLAELDAKKKVAAEKDTKSLNDLAFSFVVVPDCGAIPTMVIFVAAVLAFPTRWWRKFLGVALGVPLLYGINTLRLTVLAVIGAWDGGGAIFKFAHEYVWQGIYIIFVVVVWLAWVELLVKVRGRARENA